MTIGSSARDRLLRPIVDTAAQDRLRDVILDAYREHETELAAST